MPTRTETALAKLRAAIGTKLAEYRTRAEEAEARAAAAEARVEQADLDSATALEGVATEVEEA